MAMPLSTGYKALLNDLVYKCCGIQSLEIKPTEELWEFPVRYAN